MRVKLVSTLSVFVVIVVSGVATAQQSDDTKHAGAEEAIKKLQLQKDFGDFKLRSHQYKTAVWKPGVSGLGVPGQNGLLVVQWINVQQEAAVLAKIRWFEDKEAALAHWKSARPLGDTRKERGDLELTKVDDKTLWKLHDTAYLWTDAEHFVVSLVGSHTPPPEMLKALLAEIDSKVDELEQVQGK